MYFQNILTIIYPLLIKIKQVFLSFSNRPSTLKFQCFTIWRYTDLIYVNYMFVFFIFIVFPTRIIVKKAVPQQINLV